MPRILMLDNYDSFTYNLVQYLGELGAELTVVRNDAESRAALLKRGADALVISPGPGRPEHAGVSVECVRAFGEAGIPVLGVCLGHQGVAQAFGGRIIAARKIMHGKSSNINHAAEGLFAGLPQPFAATRYHSLAVEEESLPGELQITARAEGGEGGGEIMALQHRSLPVYGVQFHPESILTGCGKQLLQNFLDCAGAKQ